MAKQTTEVLVKVTLSYDDDNLTEAEAQDAWLQDGLVDTRSVTLEFAEIVAGLVDADGVPVQPSVRRIIDNQERAK